MSIYANLAAADDVRPGLLYDVPDGRILEPKKNFWPKEEYICFTAPEYNTISHIIIDYRWFWDYSLKLEAELKIYRAEVDNLNTQLAIWQKNLEIAENGRREIGDLFDLEMRNKLKLQKKKELEEWIWKGLTVAMIAVAAAGWVMYGVESYR